MHVQEASLCAFWASPPLLGSGGTVPAPPGSEDHAEDLSETLSLLTLDRLQNRYYQCWLTPSKPPKGENEFHLPGNGY